MWTSLVDVHQQLVVPHLPFGKFASGSRRDGAASSPSRRLPVVVRQPTALDYAVSVSGNWRVRCRFEDSAAADVDYVDYH